MRHEWLGIVATLLAAGCTGRRDEPDVFWYPDVALETDAGPPVAPVCDGVATPCSERAASECSGGCQLEQCTGEPTRCNRYSIERFCEEARGCSWTGRDCFGFAEACSAQSTATNCSNQGCSWGTTATCVGSPAACTSLSEAECASALGCSPLLDAGSPDAGRDGGRDGGLDGGRDGGLDGSREDAFVAAPPDARPTSDAPPFTYTISTGMRRFSDICAAPGSRTLLRSADDALSGVQTVAGIPGGSFTFFGASETHYIVSSNGWLTFDDAFAGSSYLSLGSATAPNRVIAPYEDDFLTTICVHESATEIVIQWTGEVPFAPTEVVEMQTILHADGRIELVYGDRHAAPPPRATDAGIEDATGSATTSGERVMPGISVLFTPS